NVAVGLLVERDARALEIQTNPPGLAPPAREPLLLRLAQRHAPQGPAQHRRHGHGGHNRHGDDHGEEVLRERAHGQSDRGHDHLGRAACVHAASEREGLAPGQPANSPPMNAPANLPKLAIAISPRVMSKRVASFRTVRSADSPAMPKKTGMKNARMRPRSCSSMCLLRIGDSPTRIPATKAPSTVCTPMKCVISAMIPMITRITVITGKSLSKLSFAHRIRK